MERHIQTVEKLEVEARSFLSALPLRQEGATLVTLSGELGAGKTAFAKALAKALGVEEEVTSPTFVLEKIYALSAGAPFARLAHIDAYRLSRGADLAPLGFSELIKDASNFILLEWPEKVKDALPEPAVCITITAEEDGSRTLSYA